MGIYREQAESMLKQWGIEMSEGGSKPNIIVMDYVGSGEGVVPNGPVMFSTIAERADRILRDINQFSPGYVEMLVSRALGLRVEDIARNNKTHINKVQIWTEGALGAFEMGIQIRVQQGVFRESTRLKRQLAEERKKRKNVLEYLNGL